LGLTDALLARQLGLRRLLVAHDGFRALHHGIGIAKSFAAAARRLGLEVVSTDAWPLHDPDEVAAAGRVKASTVNAAITGADLTNQLGDGIGAGRLASLGV
jgi:hypothetical protein